MKPLQGKWYVCALEVDGVAMLPSGSITIDDNHFESHGMGSVYRGEVAFDTSVTPNLIEMRFTEGPEKGNINRGIFELVKGGWRLCLNTRNGPAPQAFRTSGGSGFALERLAREQPVVTGVRHSLGASGTPGTSDLDGSWSMSSCIRSGEPLDKQTVAMGKRVADATRIKVTVAGGVMVDAAYTVDRHAVPMTIDYLLKDGRTQLGIYRLEGKKLTTMFAAPGAERPTAFETRVGDGSMLTEWVRD